MNAVQLKLFPIEEQSREKIRRDRNGDQAEKRTARFVGGNGQRKRHEIKTGEDTGKTDIGENVTVKNTVCKT